MTFDPRLYDEAFVWIWLPDATSPIVAGRLSVRDQRVAFNYGRSYLDRPDAISLYTPELPLVSGLSAPEAELHIAGCIDDAAPDSWGQLIVANSLQMSIPNRALNAEERLAFLLESGSDRIGALDFQRSPSDYQPRNNSDDMQLHSLQEAAEQLMRGEQLQPDLEQALIRATSSGGAHPKVSVTLDGQKYIAKFTLSNTLYNLVGAEFMAMRLAALCGLNVADVELTQVDGRQTLLVRRFDRTPAKDEGYKRKSLVSALTILGLDEMHARYASYEDLAEKIRAQFKKPHPHIARVVWPAGVQHPVQQHRRPRPQPCRFLGWPGAGTDPRLRHLPATQNRRRSEPGHADSGQQPFEPAVHLSAKRPHLQAVAAAGQRPDRGANQHHRRALASSLRFGQPPRQRTRSLFGPAVLQPLCL